MDAADPSPRPPATIAGSQEAARTAFERSLGCVRPLCLGLPRRERAAHAHPVDGERDLGDLVKRARPKIAKNLMTLSVER